MRAVPGSFGRLGALVFLAACLFAAGCSGTDAARPSQAPASQSTANPEASLPSTMPNLVGRSIESVAKLGWIGRLESDQIQVLFPATTVAWTWEGQTSNGAHQPPHAGRQTFPEVTRSLHLVRSAHHIVVSQSPAPGVSISGTVTVNLIAGAHPNHTGKPWVAGGHVAEVSRSGAASCMESPGCHTPNECVECHSSLR
jgi:hypothetical protein